MIRTRPSQHPRCCAPTSHPTLTRPRPSPAFLAQVLLRAVDARVAVTYPPYLSDAARDLLSLLLVRQPRWRLGCGPGGAADVLRHPWFDGLDWAAYRARRLHAPHVPQGLGVASGSARGSSLVAEFFRRGELLALKGCRAKEHRRAQLACADLKLQAHY